MAEQARCFVSVRSTHTFEGKYSPKLFYHTQSACSAEEAEYLLQFAADKESRLHLDDGYEGVEDTIQVRVLSSVPSEVVLLERVATIINGTNLVQFVLNHRWQKEALCRIQALAPRRFGCTTKQTRADRDAWEQLFDRIESATLNPSYSDCDKVEAALCDYEKNRSGVSHPASSNA